MKQSKSKSHLMANCRATPRPCCAEGEDADIIRTELMFTRSTTGLPDQTCSTTGWIFKKQDATELALANLRSFPLVTEKPEVIWKILWLRMARERSKEFRLFFSLFRAVWVKMWPQHILKRCQMGQIFLSDIFRCGDKDQSTNSRKALNNKYSYHV